MGIGTKHTVQYRRENCYITLTDQSLDISMVAKNPDNTVDDNTLSGLDIIGRLVTMLIEEGVENSEISAGIWECSRNKSDLADHLSMILIKELP